MNCREPGAAGAETGPAPAADALNKVYVEPTNRCNLKCVTCIRHSWDESFEDMAWPVYLALLDGLADFPEARTVAFAGFGEPLLHPRFPEMVRLAHAKGLRTELTSNAMLLTSNLAKQLIDAGLDQFTVSIDGASNASHGAIRPGASLGEIMGNMRNLHLWSRIRSAARPGDDEHAQQKMLRQLDEAACSPAASPLLSTGAAPFASVLDSLPPAPLKIGIEFVAMKSNIRELPALEKIAENIRASYILVSNVLPYTPGLQDEILYSLGPTSYEGPGDERNLHWILPKMDMSGETLRSVSAISNRQGHLSYLDIDMNQRNNYCPFIRPGSLALSCHGGVSPCPPLLHSYTCYIRDRKKFFRRCEYGSLQERSLRSIWLQPDYASFRDRVRRFDFSPCTDCCGCEFAELNETDCQGNPFPVCGDCLWARGVLRCA